MNARIHPRLGLTFDDVLLIPQQSNVRSREDVNLTVQFGPYRLAHPIIPANMQSIATTGLVRAATDHGGLALVHRFQPIEHQVSDIKYVRNPGPGIVGASVGVKESDKDTVRQLFDAGTDVFCVDVAHGDSAAALDMVKWLANAGPGDLTIIAGNVATGSAAKRLFDAGATAVKVGVGPGSLCTTRIETGNGVPQLTALIDVSETRDAYYRNGIIIADGGIKNAGDCVKALCFADMVMLGRAFAGCDEAGTYCAASGVKAYNGSSTHNTSHVEGVMALVDATGKTYNETLDHLLAGIRSGCSYQGARDLTELKDSPEFVRITQAGLVESKPHDVEIL